MSSYDPNKWTLKTQEAVATSIDRAKKESHPEVTPDHLLLVPARSARGSRAPPAVQARQTAGGSEKRARSRHGRLAEGVRVRCPFFQTVQSGDGGRRPGPLRISTTTTSPPSICFSDWPIPIRWRYRSPPRARREELLNALQEIRGSHRVTVQNPEDQFQALEKYGQDLTGRRAGQASSTPSSAEMTKSAG